MRIAVQGITRRFGDVVAVDSVDLDIAEGELFTLLGPSGCGKSTLLRLLAGFSDPDSGAIRFGDTVINHVPAHERGIGMVFQNYALWPHMTVFDNVAYGLRLRKVARPEMERRVGDVMAAVELSGLEARYPGQLSGGQQQRVALARALVFNPRILLLDEPLSNLDAKIRVQVRAGIRQLQKRLGITTVYVTHDQEEALALSDRLAVMERGRVLQVGRPRAVYERPASRFVADFIGVNNLVEGVVQSVGADGMARVNSGIGPVTATAGPGLAPGANCWVCVRPENLSFDHAAGAGNAVADIAVAGNAVAGNAVAGNAVAGNTSLAGNTFAGRIALGAYLGNAYRYDVTAGNGQIIRVDVREPWRHQEVAAGTDVRLAFEAAGAWVLPAT